MKRRLKTALFIQLLNWTYLMTMKIVKKKIHSTFFVLKVLEMLMFYSEDSMEEMVYFLVIM